MDVTVADGFEGAADDNDVEEEDEGEGNRRCSRKRDCTGTAS